MITEIINEIAKAIIDLNEEKALEIARKAISDNLDILKVIEEGLGSGSRLIICSGPNIPWKSASGFKLSVKKWQNTVVWRGAISLAKSRAWAGESE